MRELIRRLIKEDSGVTAIEYGLIAALIALAIIIAIGYVGTNLNTAFSNVAQHVSTATGS